MKQEIRLSLLAITLLAFVVGCAHSPQQTARFDDSLVGTPLTPTSTRPASRVYPGDPAIDVIGRTPAPNGASAEDWALGEELRRVLTTEKALAPFPSEVYFSVDKNTKGLVRMTGYLPSRAEQRKLRDRIEAVPGVLQLDDQTVIGVGKSPTIMRPPL